MKSGAFLKDIRNIKKGTQQHIPVTTKNIFSSKDLKKSRSSEQLNLHKFMDVLSIPCRTKTKQSNTSTTNSKSTSPKYKRTTASSPNSPATSPTSGANS